MASKLSPEERRHHQERPRSSHVTDRDSPHLRLGHLSRGSGRVPELAAFCPRGASCTTFDLASRL